MSLSFYKNGVLGVYKVNFCGNGGPMQVNVQQSLNPTIRLLEPRPEGEPGHDPALNALVEKVNRMFEQEATKLLLAKRRKLAADDDADVKEWANRLEVTVLITDTGLQLAYDFALPKKQIAPAPKKPLIRRILGPLWPYPTWEMPAKGESAKASEEPVAAVAVAKPGKPRKTRSS